MAEDTYAQDLRSKIHRVSKRGLSEYFRALLLGMNNL